MAVKDNRGQAKVKAKGTHSKFGGCSKKSKQLRKKKRGAVHADQRAGAHPATSSDCTGSSANAPLGGGNLRCLLLGEGCFGFAAALAMDWGDLATNLTATTPESEAATFTMGQEAEDNVETVRAFGGSVRFRVDATALPGRELRPKSGFDRIVLNFPSVSTTSSSKQQAVAEQQSLLRGIFKSVLSNRLLNATGGELHITLRTSEADEWSIVTLAKFFGLRVRSCSKFDASRYTGYVPPPGCENAVTYAFHEPPPQLDEAEKKAQKIAAIAKARPELRLGPTGQTYKEAWKQRHKKGKR
jgi:hypothetical protein